MQHYVLGLSLVNYPEYFAYLSSVLSELMSVAAVVWESEE